MIAAWLKRVARQLHETQHQRGQRLPADPFTREETATLVEEILVSHSQQAELAAAALNRRKVTVTLIGQQTVRFSTKHQHVILGLNSPEMAQQVATMSRLETVYVTAKAERGVIHLRTSSASWSYSGQALPVTARDLR
jgi:hypothetical protein